MKTKLGYTPALDPYQKHGRSNAFVKRVHELSTAPIKLFRRAERVCLFFTYLVLEKVAFFGRITQDDYDRKARELKERQTEIALRVEQHQQGEGDYRTTLESLISVASRAAEIFECSKTEQKRQLIAFVFSNLRLKGKKLEFSLRSPFDLMVNRANYTSWLPFLDTYRTMCLAPQPDFRRVLEDVRAMQLAA
jgi:hypothetical protein